MAIFDSTSGIELIFRWFHILAGITWIGLLYYFNFVQVPFMAEATAETKSQVTRQLAPRALWWFRYGALVTLLMGLAIITLKITDYEGGFELLGTSYGYAITSGMVLGLIMFLNVWGVIWPNQKVVIASAEAIAAGGQADPSAADRGRKAMLASRTNVVFSIPMVFFMAAASHLPLFAEGSRLVYVLVAVIVVGAFELNALMWKGGAPKSYLEKVPSAIITGFVLWAILYATLELVG